MAIRWPWQRPDSAPTTPQPAAIGDSRWHRLPPIQRTVDEITPTAPLDGFSSSLATAQNPGLLSTVGTLSTDNVNSPTILGTADRPVATPTEPVAPQPRTWQPTLNLPQRILPAPANVQRSVDVPEPADAGIALPVVVPAAEPAPLTNAPDPVERREVVAVAPSAVLDPAPVDDPAPTHADTVVGSAPTHDVPPTPAQPVQRSTAPTPSTPRAVQRVDEPDAPVPTVAVSTPRADHPEISVAQRVDSMAPAPASTPPLAKAAELPAEPAPLLAQHEPAADTQTAIEDTAAEMADPPTVAAVVEHSVAPPPPHVQRSTPIESITWFGPDDRVGIPLPAPGPGPGPGPGQTIDRSEPAPRPHPVTPLQRVAEPTAESPRSASPSPHEPPSVAAEQHSETPPVQRLTLVPELPEAPQHGAPIDAATVTPEPRVPIHQAQRIQTSPPPARTLSAAPPVPVPAVQRIPATFDADPRPVPSPTRLDTVDELPATPHETTPSAAPPTMTPLPAPRPTPAVQRLAETAAPAQASMVVRLPAPTATAEPPPAAAHQPTRIVESPPPMSLQRMFERAATHEPHHEPAPPTSSATISQSGGYTDITFPQYTVQRDAESAEAASPDAQSAPTETPAASVTATPSPSPAAPVGTNIDELVNRLYDPLAARLRTELWLDRERAGVLMDLRR